MIKEWPKEQISLIEEQRKQATTKRDFFVWYVLRTFFLLLGTFFISCFVHFAVFVYVQPHLFAIACLLFTAYNRQEQKSFHMYYIWSRQLVHIFEGFFCNFFHVHTERLFIVWYRKRVTTESLSSHPMHFSANVFSSRKLPVYTIFKEAKRVTSRKATFVVMPRSSFGKCCVLCCVKKSMCQRRDFRK